MEVLEKICLMLMLVNIVFCLIALIKKVRVDEEQVQELTRKIPRLGSGECERALYDEIISNRKIYLMIVSLELSFCYGRCRLTLVSLG